MDIEMVECNLCGARFGHINDVYKIEVRFNRPNNGWIGPYIGPTIENCHICFDCTDDRQMIGESLLSDAHLEDEWFFCIDMNEKSLDGLYKGTTGTGQHEFTDAASLPDDIVEIIEDAMIPTRYIPGDLE